MAAPAQTMPPVGAATYYANGAIKLAESKASHTVTDSEAATFIQRLVHPRKPAKAAVLACKKPLGKATAAPTIVDLDLNSFSLPASKLAANVTAAAVVAIKK